MQIVAKVAAAMQAVFGATLNERARATGCVQRQRKFSGVSLMRTLVLTLLHRPAAENRDYRATAAKLGVQVTEEAIAHLTGNLVRFLEETLKQAVAQTLAANPVSALLLRKFTDVRIGDSTTLMLPDELAEQFPGCGGTGKACMAALKIQVLWSLTTGQLLRWLLEPARASDALSEIATAMPPAGSLSIFDLGYFFLERFRRIGDAAASWISRLQHHTKVFDRAGARDHGREASQEYLALQEWTLFVTNSAPELLTWKEVVVLYRARWQIELLFKLWKSHNRLAQRETKASPDRHMAVLYAKLIGVIVQHWMLLTATWNDGRRSLRKAAIVLRDWVVLLSEALDHRQRLCGLLRRMAAALAESARITRRRKHPSLFQLLENPDLLEYTLA